MAMMGLTCYRDLILSGKKKTTVKRQQCSYLIHHQRRLGLLELHHILPPSIHQLCILSRSLDSTRRKALRKATNLMTLRDHRIEAIKIERCSILIIYDLANGEKYQWVKNEACVSTWRSFK